VKTQNLTPWCNLFLTESKYRICVKKSYYKTLLYIGGLVVLFILPLLLFTYAYSLVLAIVAFSFLILGRWLSSNNINTITAFDFEITDEGGCSFGRDKSYQLQNNSRVSFLGCWLILQSIPTAHSMFNTKCNNKITSLFICRDSLSNQDFSRLSTIISLLNRQP